MALEELGLEITTQGWAAFNSKMQAADKVIGKTADNWVALGKSADKAARPLDTVAKRMQAAAKSAGDVLTKLRPVGIALSAVAVAGAALIRSSTLVAARNEMLAVVLETVGRNAGYSERQLAQYEKSVKALGITTQAARQSLIQMAQADIDMAHATDLARLAQDAAVISQENSSVAFQKLITIIQTGNVLMGRRMGLTLDFAGANDRMATSLGISTDALTQEQRVQARLNEVMRQGVTIAGTYEAAMGTAGKAMTSLPRYWEEARAALGEHFLPMLGQAVQALTGLLKWFNALDEGTKRIASSFLGMGTVTAGVAGAFILLVPKVIAFTTAMAGAGIAMATVLPIIAAVAVAAAALYTAMEISSRVHEGHAQASSAWAAMLRKEAQMARNAAEVADAYAESVARVTAEYEKAPWYAKPFIDVQGMAVESLGEARAAIRETATSLDDYNAALTTVAEAAGYLVDAEGNLVEVTVSARGVRRQLIEENYLAAESEWTLSESVAATGEATRKSSRRMREMAGAVGEVTASEEELAARLTDLKELMEGPVGKQNAEYAEAQADISAKIRDTRAALREAEEAYGTNSEEAAGLRDELGDLGQAATDLAAQHREAMNQIIYDMMMARLATDGWTEAEVELALQVAEGMGLIDEETRIAAQAMNQALTDFAEGEGVNRTIHAIMDIAARLAAIPTDISIDIRAHMVAADIGVVAPGAARYRQRGGPVAGGRPYWVGERGPEIFVPSTAGTVIDNSRSMSYQYNLTTQSTTRPGALAQEFGAMAFVGAGPSR